MPLTPEITQRILKVLNERINEAEGRVRQLRARLYAPDKAHLHALQVLTGVIQQRLEASGPGAPDRRRRGARGPTPPVGRHRRAANTGRTRGRTARNRGRE